jgi:uncharacterized protein (DUF2384 family)
MNALAPLIENPIAAQSEMLSSSQSVDPGAIEAQLADQNELLGRERGVPESVRLFVEVLADQLASAPAEATLRTDPYLLVSLQRSMIAALRAIEREDDEAARAELRIRLEQLRHVYRDLADVRPVFEDRPASELLQWLDEELAVPQPRLAAILGVSPRTLQRWLSPSGSATPADADADRVRLVASVVAHLRHSLTGRGVIGWFERPHPMIEDRAPKQLLDEPEALQRLSRLAASTRSSLAA